MTPLSVIELAPESLAQVDEFAAYVQERLENGEIDALRVYSLCKGMMKAMEACVSVLQEKATEEAQQYGKTFEKHNFKYEVKEVGVKYIFDNCNDPKLFSFTTKLNEAKADVDARQKFLKSLKQPVEIADDDTGEVFTVNPAVKTSKTSVTVEMK